MALHFECIQTDGIDELSYLVEWKNGHIPNALPIFPGDLRERIADLHKGKPTAVYCDSGYRAGRAASILRPEGLGCVRNIPGSWQAWRDAGYAEEGDGEPEK